MDIKAVLFNRDNIPDHINEEINDYVTLIFEAVFPKFQDAKSLNEILAAMNWVTFLCIKTFVADHHQEKAVLDFAKSVLLNLEKFKDKDLI